MAKLEINLKSKQFIINDMNEKTCKGILLKTVETGFLCINGKDKIIFAPASEIENIIILK